MNKLVKELDKKNRAREKEINEDSILKDAEQVLLEAHSHEEQLLNTLGLDHQIQYSRDLQYDVRRTAMAKARYEKEIYLGKDIKELCNEFDLKILPSRYYNGSIPVSLARDIQAFLDKNNFIARVNSFYILAPSEQFNTIKHVPIQADPILFYLDGSAESGRGDKSHVEEGDRLINVTFWGNDFTAIRKFKWLINKHRHNSGGWTNLDRTICGISLVIFYAIIQFIMMYYFDVKLPLLYSIPLFLAILGLYLESMSQKTRRLDEYWNTNRYY